MVVDQLPQSRRINIKIQRIHDLNTATKNDVFAAEELFMRKCFRQSWRSMILERCSLWTNATNAPVCPFRAFETPKRLAPRLPSVSDRMDDHVVFT